VLFGDAATERFVKNGKQPTTLASGCAGLTETRRVAHSTNSHFCLEKVMVPFLDGRRKVNATHHERNEHGFGNWRRSKGVRYYRWSTWCIGLAYKHSNVLLERAVFAMPSNLKVRDSCSELAWRLTMTDNVNRRCNTELRIRKLSVFVGSVTGVLPNEIHHRNGRESNRGFAAGGERLAIGWADGTVLA